MYEIRITAVRMDPDTELQYLVYTERNPSKDELLKVAEKYLNDSVIVGKLKNVFNPDYYRVQIIEETYGNKNCCIEYVDTP